MENAVKARQVPYLWHFTRIENVDSILLKGIVPRSMLQEDSVPVQYNDAHRFDGHLDANCLSIGHPNYKMFYMLRMSNRDQEWVAIAIKPDVLWLMDCAFCYENAASYSVRCIPMQSRKGVVAFEKLFLPDLGKPDRETLKLPVYCPTNPQAEVLVFGTIEPKYILGIATQSLDRSNELKARHPDIYIRYHRAPFDARIDYQYWK